MLSSPNNVNSQMQQLADNAVIAAKDKFNTSLDFTENSLQKLEILLQQAHEGYKRASSSGNSQNITIENTVRVWGSYFGEVIRRILGGNWMVDQNKTYFKLGSQRVDPLGQVRSRIVEGPVNNIQSIFQGLKSGIQNNLIGGPINLGVDITMSKQNTRNNRPAIIRTSIFGLIILCILSIGSLWMLNRQGILSLPFHINFPSNVLVKTSPVDILTSNGFTPSLFWSDYLMMASPDCPSQNACPAYGNGKMQVAAAFIKDMFFIQIWIEPNQVKWEDQLSLVENILRTMCGNEISNWVDNNIQAAQMNANINAVYANEIMYPNETVGKYQISENFGYLGGGTPTFSVTILPITQK